MKYLEVEINVRKAHLHLFLEGIDGRLRLGIFRGFVASLLELS